MPDVTDSLRAVLVGGSEASGAILHNCRMEGGAASAFGHEAILGLFAAQPLGLSEVRALASAGCAALFAQSDAGPVALFADCHGENVARLFFLGPQALQPARLERVDVPFDPVLGQDSPLLGFRDADHPQLRADDAQKVREAATGLIAAAVEPRVAQRLTRLRGCVIRAFSTAGDGIAFLLVATGTRVGGLPGLVQFAVGVHLPEGKAGNARVVVDRATLEAETARPWRAGF